MSDKLIVLEYGGSNFTTWHETVLCVCHSSAIYTRCSVESYFNNGLRFVRENASQPREQTSLFGRARHLFVQTSVPKSYGISSRSVYTRTRKRKILKINGTRDARTNGQEHWILCRCYLVKGSVVLHTVTATFWLAITATLFQIIMIVNWLFW
jgi:hypothetical protein